MLYLNGIWNCNILISFIGGIAYFMDRASMSYSLSKSLGDNAIGLTAYYLSSPFNLLLYFTDNIPLFVSIATVLKLASASLTVSVFLSYRFCDMKYIWNLLLSVSYGLMGYNLCQASNIMWLDGVIWLPIHCAGHMEASVRTQNSPALFIRCFCDHKQLVYRLYDLSVFIFLFYI